MREDGPTVAAYISAGSSIEPQKNLLAAMQMLQARLRVTAVSTVYRTPALGRPNDPDFLNCVFEAETAIGPRSLKFDVLRPVEDALGRTRDADKYGPRTIDLDLILYGAMVIHEPDLKIPHEDLTRWYVRIPLLELAPELDVLGAGRLSSDLKDPDENGQAGEPLADFTASLRRRLLE